jgi:hypothetical protein
VTKLRKRGWKRSRGRPNERGARPRAGRGGPGGGVFGRNTRGRGGGGRGRLPLPLDGAFRGILALIPPLPTSTRTRIIVTSQPRYTRESTSQDGGHQGAIIGSAWRDPQTQTKPPAAEGRGPPKGKPPLILFRCLGPFYAFCEKQQQGLTPQTRAQEPFSELSLPWPGLTSPPLRPLGLTCPPFPSTSYLLPSNLFLPRLGEV